MKYQPIKNFRPNDLGNYRGKRPYTGWRGSSLHQLGMTVEESGEIHRLFGPSGGMTQPELLAHMLKVDAEQ